MEAMNIKRINELYKKSKTEGLSEEEKKEQQALRKVYLENIRRNFTHTLDSIVIVNDSEKKSYISEIKSEG